MCHHLTFQNTFLQVRKLADFPTGSGGPAPRCSRGLPPENCHFNHFICNFSIISREKQRGTWCENHFSYSMVTRNSISKVSWKFQRKRSKNEGLDTFFVTLTLKKVETEIIAKNPLFWTFLTSSTPILGGIDLDFTYCLKIISTNVIVKVASKNIENWPFYGH